MVWAWMEAEEMERSRRVWGWRDRMESLNGSIEAKAAVKDDFWGEWEGNSWLGGRAGRS